MNSSHNSVETAYVAATAIVTADGKTQPNTVLKKKWGSCWSHYWCFGSHKHNRRIRQATLVPEPPSGPLTIAPVSENSNHWNSIVIPLRASPSSPVSFLQSNTPSTIQSLARLLFLSNAHFLGGATLVFTVGPYANETQLVTPPGLSAATTESSTACFTPPPEPTQLTTPPSPEVPYAQLLPLTPTSVEQNFPENQFSDNGSEKEYVSVDQRVSFELNGKHIPSCCIKEHTMSSQTSGHVDCLKKAETSYKSCAIESANGVSGNDLGGEGEKHYQKH